jgi:hypothetical protein
MKKAKKIHPSLPIEKYESKSGFRHMVRTTNFWYAVAVIVVIFGIAYFMK